MSLSLAHRVEGEVCTVVATGVIDFGTAPELEDVIGAALGDAVAREPAAAVEVDLSAVTFIDSAGINGLLKGRRSADEHGLRFRITGCHGMVRELLELTGVWTHLTSRAG